MGKQRKASTSRAKVAKSRRSDAERAAEHYLYEVCGCDPKQMRRAVRTKFQSVDFWAADVAARTTQGFCYYAQVTAGQQKAVQQRRRKLEKISWNTFDHVLLLQLVSMPNPANARKKDFFFRIHRYNPVTGKWVVDDIAWPVPRDRFRKLKVED